MEAGSLGFCRDCKWWGDESPPDKDGKRQCHGIWGSGYDQGLLNALVDWFQVSAEFGCALFKPEEV